MSGDDDRAGEALGHLRTAALELIKAARAALDVAEDVVREPAEMTDLLAGLAGLVDLAGRTTRSQAAAAEQSDNPEADPDDGGKGPVDRVAEGGRTGSSRSSARRVTRIPLDDDGAGAGS